MILASHSAPAQNTVPGPNSDPTYVALRNLTLSGESVAVRNLVLKRDSRNLSPSLWDCLFRGAGKRKGNGAVFTGDGTFMLDPPIEAERRSLNLLTKETEFSERFAHLVLRFTDSTYDDFKKIGHPGNRHLRCRTVER